MFELMRLMLIAGAILLVLLSWTDFRNKLRASRKATPNAFYLIFVLFSAVNIGIYMSLGYLFLEHDPIALIMAGERPAEFTMTPLKPIQPVLIALMYFGVGVAKVKIGDTEFNLYSKMLALFETLLIQPPELELAKIQAALKRAQYKALLTGIEELRILKNGDKGWDLLDSAWNTYNVKQIEKEIDELYKIKKEIEEQVNHDTIKRDLDRDISELTDRLLENLNKYLIEFIKVNGKTNSHLSIISEKIKITNLAKPRDLKGPPILKRAVVIAILMGISFGPIVSISGEGDSTMYAWIGVLSLVPFAVILSLPMKNSATSGVHTFLFAGIVAGLIGHAIWLLLEQNIAVRDIYTANFVQLRQLLTGLAFGGGVGFLLYICNHYIRAKRYPKYVKYVLASIAGALLFPLIYLLLFRQLNDWIPYAQSSLVGIVVILVMTFSTYVFEERKR